MQLDEIQRRSREIFRTEAAELLEELEAALLALESDPADSGLINRVFRVMHTLKGSGATSGFQDLSDFLHKVEDVFNAARESRLQINSRIIDLTLKLADAVTRYLAAAPPDSAAVLEASRGELDALLTFLPAATKKSGPAVAAASAKTSRFHVSFRPQRDLFRNGSDPGMFLDDLRTLGPCTIQGFTDEVPPFAKLDPEVCYLRWEIEVTTEAGEDAVRGVFMFIEGECDLEIKRVEANEEPAGAAPANTGIRPWFLEFQTTERSLASPGALEALWRDLGRFGPLQTLSSPPEANGTTPPGCWRLRLETDADADTINSAFVFLLDAQPRITLEPFAAPEAIRTPVAAMAAVPSAPKAAISAGARANGDTLRVSAERLDRLVNLVGELVILRSQVSNACATAANLPEGLAGAAEALQSLSTEMRDVILNIRMMPIEQTFSKFRRLARDLARDLNKEIDLVVEGGETEMDKTVLDALADPLMHLVRNSLDHGLEPAAEREAAGKARRGTLRLRAEQRGDRVLVSVTDDGRGLDAERIRAKAIRQGLLAADAQPTEAELFQMVFLPGFSTAEKVSQVSGRGVGLDVVRRHVEQLRGKVEVRSERGRGAEFRLSMPLTLAIIEGLLVELDGERYILPLGIARETIELTRAQRAAGNGRNVVALRGELVPYVRLRDLFSFTSEPPDPERVIIVEIEDQRLGLVIDRVIGNHQTVLKSLGWIGRRVPVFSGATVLGDGQIALVLDVPALLAHHRSQSGSTTGLTV
jgi:two-component system chemotaxis sensor kinase CheA